MHQPKAPACSPSAMAASMTRAWRRACSCRTDQGSDGLVGYICPLHSEMMKALSLPGHTSFFRRAPPLLPVWEKSL